jgi:sugar lactone lactonase YvrE
MESQQLRRVEHDGTLALHADLSAIARGSLNDMIVASDGTAYIGDMGSRIHEGGDRQPGQTIAVRPERGSSLPRGWNRQTATCLRPTNACC